MTDAEMTAVVPVQPHSLTPTASANRSAFGLPCAVAVLIVCIFALTGCGESAEAKAEKQVCSARSDISKQVTKLQGLTLSTASVAAARASLEALSKDVTQIKDAQKKLSPSRRQELEAATSTFVSQVNSIASGLKSNLSVSNAEAQFKSAMTQLANAYKQTLEPIACK